ncbi:adenosylcobinamide-phosphate synthase CbiB [Pedobacter cryoconitis]|uniref:Cobalamin biosynthesis protein CobD n=1 Tax=Pedobacter cryoconitis TaxID=188932 RepID=A0A7X0MJK9_9SPHI|nr:adenosylcobinamide-phosphate synthase CbiB [Pedobacter cryoconitis]MBB6501587.1 adenosylcobinamide-phosphate synthase [Pedobacter cryoconitis]
METYIIIIIPLLAGYLLDLIFGDPEGLPHPVRLFGSLISFAEKQLNKGKFRFIKGMLMVLVLCSATFFCFYFLIHFMLSHSVPVYFLFATAFVYYALANKGLIAEGKQVFDALKYQGLEAGRKRLSRIVGRDTSNLDSQQIRVAVLETMSENLSDGVIAPLFFYFIAGIPGMLTYKMINTMDSMVGYRNDRYEYFGKFAARLDDVANFIPARITTILMLLVTFSLRGWRFVLQYGHQHKSPNAGYPEAALAGILDVQFGGPNVYHGILVDKPIIGSNNREIKHEEFQTVSSINQSVCLLMVLSMAIYFFQL